MRRAVFTALLVVLLATNFVSFTAELPSAVHLSPMRCGSGTIVRARNATVFILDKRDHPAMNHFTVYLEDYKGRRVDQTDKLDVGPTTVAYSSRGLTNGVYYLKLYSSEKELHEYQIFAQPTGSGDCQ